jgi:hypothetical protein
MLHGSERLGDHKIVFLRMHVLLKNLRNDRALQIKEKGAYGYVRRTRSSTRRLGT